VAERAGVPTVFLGHTLGPLRSRLATRLTARVLRRATAVVVREPESLATALELGVDPARAVLAADLAFALVPAATDPVDRVVCERWLAGHRLLVIAARRHPYLEDEAARRLVAEVAAAARALLGRGVVTRVAVVAHTLGPTPVEDDRPAAAAIASAIGRRAVFIDDDLGPQELASLYGRAAVVVAVRLHAAILSMVGGTPAVVISYFTAKAPGVMAGLGAAASVADYDAVDADTLRRDVEALVRSTGTRTWVTEAVAASRQKLDDALDVVEQLLAADLARQADKAAKADKADLLAGERLEETGAAA
jgi:colanic acid/amylovoran biosynthesis protein